VFAGELRWIHQPNWNGRLSSKYSFAETSRVEASFTKGFLNFLHLDHSGEAKTSFANGHPTACFVSETLRAERPVMVASPRFAIDLPLKLWLVRCGWKSLGQF